MEPLPLPPVLERGAPHVTQLLLFATHAPNTGWRAPEESKFAEDLRYFLHSARQLRRSSQLWVLRFDVLRTTDTASVDLQTSAAIEGGVYDWGLGAIRRELPALGARMSSHPGLAADCTEDLAQRAKRRAGDNQFKCTPDPNHRRYWYFHASLVLFNRSLGHHYPRLQYVWRVEPDVLYSGAWGNLFARFDGTPVDLLLPHTITYGTEHHYPHWELSAESWRHLPRSDWAYSLVSVGRYSLNFLALLAARWRRGELGYEEVFLLNTCVLAAPACTYRTFSNQRTDMNVGKRRAQAHSHVGDHFRYRPQWECAEFLHNYTAGRATGELWHPVKNRSCWVAYLDSCDPTGCRG